MGSRENKEGDSAKFSPKEALRLMRELLAALPGYRPDAGISARSRNELQETIAVLVARLQELSAALDPVRVPAEVLDPSDPQVMGALIASTLLSQPRKPAFRTSPRESTCESG